ncbi:unnamed protein product [Sympodiomycopsis kandeliae]
MEAVQPKHKAGLPPQSRPQRQSQPQPPSTDSSPSLETFLKQISAGYTTESNATTLPLHAQTSLIATQLSNLEQSTLSLIKENEEEISGTIRGQTELQSTLDQLEKRVGSLTRDAQVHTPQAFIPPSLVQSIEAYTASHRSYQQNSILLTTLTLLQPLLQAVEDLELHIQSGPLDSHSEYESQITAAESHLAIFSLRGPHAWIRKGNARALIDLEERISHAKKQADAIFQSAWTRAVQVIQKDNGWSIHIASQVSISEQDSTPMRTISTPVLLDWLQSKGKLSGHLDLLANRIGHDLAASLQSSDPSLSASITPEHDNTLSISTTNTGGDSQRTGTEACTQVIQYLSTVLLSKINTSNRERFSKAFLSHILTPLLSRLRSSPPSSLSQTDFTSLNTKLQTLATSSRGFYTFLTTHHFIPTVLIPESETDEQYSNVTRLLHFSDTIGEVYGKRLASEIREKSRKLLVDGNTTWEDVEEIEVEPTIILPDEQEENSVEEMLPVSNNDTQSRGGDGWGWGDDDDDDDDTHPQSSKTSQPVQKPRGRAALGGVRVVKPRDQMGSGPFPAEVDDIAVRIMKPRDQMGSGPFPTATDAGGDDAWGFGDEDDDVAHASLSDQARVAEDIHDEEDDPWFQDQIQDQQTVHHTQPQSQVQSSTPAHSTVPTPLQATNEAGNEAEDDPWFVDESPTSTTAAQEAVSSVPGSQSQPIQPPNANIAATHPSAPIEDTHATPQTPPFSTQPSLSSHSTPSEVSDSSFSRTTRDFDLGAFDSDDYDDDEDDDAWGLSEEEKTDRVAAKRASRMLGLPLSKSVADALAGSSAGITPTSSQVNVADVQDGRTSITPSSSSKDVKAEGITPTKDTVAVDHAQEAAAPSANTSIPQVNTEAETDDGEDDAWGWSEEDKTDQATAKGPSQTLVPPPSGEFGIGEPEESITPTSSQINVADLPSSEDAATAITPSSSSQEAQAEIAIPAKDTVAEHEIEKETDSAEHTSIPQINTGVDDVDDDDDAWGLSAEEQNARNYRRSLLFSKPASAPLVPHGEQEKDKSATEAEIGHRDDNNGAHETTPASGGPGGWDDMFEDDGDGDWAPNRGKDDREGVLTPPAVEREQLTEENLEAAAAAERAQHPSGTQPIDRSLALPAFHKVAPSEVSSVSALPPSPKSERQDLDLPTANNLEPGGITDTGSVQDETSSEIAFPIESALPDDLQPGDMASSNASLPATPKSHPANSVLSTRSGSPAPIDIDKNDQSLLSRDSSSSGTREMFSLNSALPVSDAVSHNDAASMTGDAQSIASLPPTPKAESRSRLAADPRSDSSSGDQRRDSLPAFPPSAPVSRPYTPEISLYAPDSSLSSDPPFPIHSAVPYSVDIGSRGPASIAGSDVALPPSPYPERASTPSSEAGSSDFSSVADSARGDIPNDTTAPSSDSSKELEGRDRSATTTAASLVNDENLRRMRDTPQPSSSEASVDEPIGETEDQVESEPATKAEFTTHAVEQPDQAPIQDGDEDDDDDPWDDFDSGSSAVEDEQSPAATRAMETGLAAAAASTVAQRAISPSLSSSSQRRAVSPSGASPQLKQATLRAASAHQRPKQQTREASNNPPKIAARPQPVAERPAPVTPKRRTEKSKISKRSRHLMNLAHGVVDEAIQLAEARQEAGQDSESLLPSPLHLLGSVGDIFELHRALMPNLHAQVLRDVPSLAVQFANDCQFLAKEMLSLDEKIQSTESLSGYISGSKLDLMSEAQRTTLVGKSIFETQLKIQAELLNEHLSETDSLLGVYQDDRFSSVTKIHHQIVHLLKSLYSSWSSVLNESAVKASMGTLIEAILLRVYKFVLDMDDIGEIEGNRISELINIFKELESLFTSPREITFFVPSWLKVIGYLPEILLGSLADVEYLLFDGGGLDTTQEGLGGLGKAEVKRLIRSTFADTTRRRALLARVDAA